VLNNTTTLLCFPLRWVCFHRHFLCFVLACGD
jgi:hypothetical protein